MSIQHVIVKKHTPIGKTIDFEISYEIEPESGRGWAEVYRPYNDSVVEVGMIFAINDKLGIFELEDYDGCFSLPDPVALILGKKGIHVDPVCLLDYETFDPSSFTIEPDKRFDVSKNDPKVV